MTIRVLLADDHSIVRDGIRALLNASSDIEVVDAVGNGREAVRRVLELKPDVAIMDVTMPDLNGIDAARMLHEQCPGTRIVMLSMHSSSEHVYRALEAGAAGYLLKGSAGKEVVTAVRTVYMGRNYLSRALDTFERRSGTEDRRTSPVASLSARERQVLQLVVEGHSSTEIAAMIQLSPKSIDTYRARFMQKLGLADLPALVKFAIQHGLTSPD